MFILEVTLMNPPNTSREEIMRVSRKIVSEKGLPALNMRALAKECGIALGTLYNYYSDKDELVVAAIESVWQDILEKSAPDSGVQIFAVCNAYLCAYPQRIERLPRISLRRTLYRSPGRQRERRAARWSAASVKSAGNSTQPCGKTKTLTAASFQKHSARKTLLSTYSTPSRFP